MAIRKIKIKWKSVYFPYGCWVDENDAELQYRHSPGIPHFRATIDGKPVLVVMVNARSSAGHGESSSTSKVPMFLDAETLRELDPKSWIEVSLEI